MADNRIKLFSDSPDKTIRKNIKPGDRIFIDMDDTVVNHDKIKSKVSDGEITNKNATSGMFLKYSIPYKGCVETIKELSKNSTYIF